MKKAVVFLIVLGIFSVGMILTGCGTIPPAEVLPPGSNTAKVYFIMPSGVTVTGFGAITVGINFSLWYSDTFLSYISGRDYLVLNFPAGVNFISALGNNVSIVKANLVAGKNYYLRVTTLPGFNTPHVMLSLIDPQDPVLDELIDKDCKEITPNGKVSEDMVEKVAKALADAQNDPEKIDLVIR